jgi:hypothetical protein
VAGLSRRVGICATLFLAGTLLAGCGTSAGVAEARHACSYVAQALKLEQRAKSLSGSAQAQMQSDAMATLIRGNSYAARATSADGQWNALQTTIGEAQRVPISDLAPSLRRICQVANSASPYL